MIPYADSMRHDGKKFYIFPGFLHSFYFFSTERSWSLVLWRSSRFKFLHRIANPNIEWSTTNN